MKTITEIRLECIRLVQPWVTSKVIGPSYAIQHATEIYRWVMDTEKVSARDNKEFDR